MCCANPSFDLSTLESPSPLESPSSPREDTKKTQKERNDGGKGNCGLIRAPPFRVWPTIPGAPPFGAKGVYSSMLCLFIWFVSFLKKKAKRLKHQFWPKSVWPKLATWDAFFSGAKVFFWDTKVFLGDTKLFLTFWKIKRRKGGVQRSATQKAAAKAAAARTRSTVKAAQAAKTAAKTAQTTGEIIQTFGQKLQGWVFQRQRQKQQQGQQQQNTINNSKPQKRQQKQHEQQEKQHTTRKASISKNGKTKQHKNKKQKKTFWKVKSGKGVFFTQQQEQGGPNEGGPNPEKLRPRGVGPRRVLPKGARNFAFFFPPPLFFILSSLSWGSSFSWNFGGV